MTWVSGISGLSIQEDTGRQLQDKLVSLVMSLLQHVSLRKLEKRPGRRCCDENKRTWLLDVCYCKVKHDLT